MNLKQLQKSKDQRLLGVEIWESILESGVVGVGSRFQKIKSRSTPDSNIDSQISTPRSRWSLVFNMLYLFEQAKKISKNLASQAQTYSLSERLVS